MRVGILGGGQLGRMMALAGMPLGVRFRALDPSPDAPAGQVCELMTGAYEDEAVLRRFASGVDVVTYEFENVPASAVRTLSALVPVLPPPAALEAGQDRLAEKRLFRQVGMGVHDFEAVSNAAELRHAVARLGTPAVVKTRRMGYDGRGQFVLRTPGDIDAACAAMSAGGSGGGSGGLGNSVTGPAGGMLVERFVAFEREVSIVAVRGLDGRFAAYPLTQNVHARGILRRSVAPAPAVASLQERAEGHARAIMEAVGYVGVMAVEFFVVRGEDGREELLGNEVAPRVHNSGHWTIDGAVTSQFENHVRAVLGLPLGSCEARGSSVMINLIGDSPRLAALLAVPGVHVHLYGKSARPGRKIGHATAVGATPAEAAERAARIEGMLAGA